MTLLRQGHRTRLRAHMKRLRNHVTKLRCAVISWNGGHLILGLVPETAGSRRWHVANARLWWLVNVIRDGDDNGVDDSRSRSGSDVGPGTGVRGCVVNGGAIARDGALLGARADGASGSCGANVVRTAWLQRQGDASSGLTTVGG
uniref:Uncharacterized protein n=1 Tax=Romanomermis culicivorax TaxID=13658 RepID=A0A915KNM2_ROMCU